MNKQKLPMRELLSIVIGELLISLAICGVYALIGRFSYKVPLGAALGSAVTVLNFLVLSLMTNRVLNAFIQERGTEELDDEAAVQIAKKYEGKVQNQIKLSFILRMLVMLAALVVAFLIEQFDVIATVIPLLAFRPIITISSIIGSKKHD